MTDSNKPTTIPMECLHCENNEAYVTTHNQHMTARCTRCHKYIKHISQKEYRERAYPQETTWRKEIKELVDAWCEKHQQKGYVGWKRLYTLFEKNHGVDLVIWSQGGGNKKRKFSGLDVAIEMGVMEQLHQVAIEHFSETEETPSEPAPEPEIDYPQELIDRIKKQIPDDILQVIQAKGLDIIGIYRLIKEHIIVYQAEQFYSDKQRNS